MVIHWSPHTESRNHAWSSSQFVDSNVLPCLSNPASFSQNYFQWVGTLGQSVYKQMSDEKHVIFRFYLRWCITVTSAALSGISDMYLLIIFFYHFSVNVIARQLLFLHHILQYVLPSDWTQKRLRVDSKSPDKWCNSKKKKHFFLNMFFMRKKTWPPKKKTLKKCFFFKYSFKRNYKLTVA